MIIMSVVLTGLTTLFVQGSNAELDMNRRFEAQQDSRVALDKIRREIHCAQGAATNPTTGEAPTHHARPARPVPDRGRRCPDERHLVLGPRLDRSLQACTARSA